MEVIHDDSEEVRKVPSNNYISSNREEDQIEVVGLKKTPTHFKVPHNESHDEKEDIEESNSLKPSTKEEHKGLAKFNSAKVAPEGASETTSQRRKSLAKKKNYLNVSAKELKEDYNIGECRRRVANFMRSKPVDVFIITLILLYTLLVVVYLAIDDEIEDNHGAEISLQIVELVFLFIFCIEISLNLIGFGCLFIKDYWNIADITVILLAIAFVILDMVLDDSSLSGLFRLRGLFRLLRVGILIRKFDSIRKKSQARRRMKSRDIYHVSSPAEVVNEILCSVRDMIDNDDELVEDLNYCIKMVSSGKLYEANIDENAEGVDEGRKEAISFFKSYQGKGLDDKKMSDKDQKHIEQKISTIDIEDRLSLTPQSKRMLTKSNTLEFDIFEFKELTKEKEMFVLSSYILNHHNLFRAFKMDPEVYFKFITRIQDKYNAGFIEYHNKTHGTDVCQTSYFFLNGCDLQVVCSISDLEFGAMMIAACCHDFEHFGFNNPFLIESRLPWAIQYNDKSPLENHHIAASFSIIEMEEYSIFKNLDKDDYKAVRKLMIDLVLATDAANHFSDLAKFKSRVG